MVYVFSRRHRSVTTTPHHPIPARDSVALAERFDRVIFSPGSCSSLQEIEDGVRFAVDTFTRAANRIDQLAMKTIGGSLQDSNWENLVTKVIEASGGVAAEGVQISSDELSDEAAGEVGADFGELVQERQRMDRRESARPRSE